MAKKNKKKLASPVKSQKGIERAYTKELNKLGRALIKSVRADILEPLKANQESFVIDGIANQLSTAFNKLSSTYLGFATESFATSTATNMVAKTSKANKNKFFRSMKAATGVNLEEVIVSEGLEDFVSISIQENTKLITDLPDKYLKQVQTIVNNGVKNGTKYKEIEKQIMAKTGSASSKLADRIKTIARNEVSTINAQLTLRRSEQLGIKKGIWRTAEDERVRGNPSGPSPNAKPSHFKANGQEFELSKGLKVDGEFIKPGIPINCRCFYSPVIEV